MEEHKAFEEDFLRQEGTLRETLNIGQDIMKRCHPDAVSTMKHWLSVLKARWEEVCMQPFFWWKHCWSKETIYCNSRTHNEIKEKGKTDRRDRCVMDKSLTYKLEHRFDPLLYQSFGWDFKKRSHRHITLVVGGRRTQTNQQNIVLMNKLKSFSYTRCIFRLKGWVFMWNRHILKYIVWISSLKDF